MKYTPLYFNYGNNKELVLQRKKILTSRNFNSTRLLKRRNWIFLFK